MSLEIEKKYRLTPEQVNEVLLALDEEGAEFVGEDLEENIIYGGGVLDEQKAIVRIRRTEDRTVLTYKRRIFNDMPIKQQIEHESEVSNAVEIEAILENLGLEPRVVYEKRRRTWNFRSVEIVLDELPFGLYMEIEGPVMAIAEAEMYLDIGHFEPEHETYPRLTMRLGKRNGDRIEARFETA
jgi:adenylate cyclase class 2